MPKTRKLHRSITHSWNIAEIVRQYPETSEVFTEWQLHCFGCEIGAVENVHDGCLTHGFSEDEIALVVKDLNEAIRAVKPRPNNLTITKEAAREVQNIAKREKTSGQGLSVVSNADGSFAMEFRKRKRKGEKEFRSSDIPTVRLYATPATLKRVGGAVIAFREGRFKLEIDN